MNGYNLIRAWYNFKFDNQDKVRHVHSDFYCYLVDQWNRLGQKESFGLPTSVTMQCLGIGSYNTYKKALNDLIDFGFLILVKDSKNDHHSKIVALSKIDKATDKALDKATAKAVDKASDEPTDKATDKATDTIVKQINKGTKEQINKGTKESSVLLSAIPTDLVLNENEEIAKSFWELFKHNLLSTGMSATPNLDKAQLGKWSNQIRLMIEIDKRTVEELRSIWVFLKSDAFWKKNIQSIESLRRHFDKLYLTAKNPTKKKDISNDEEFINEVKQSLGL